MIRVYYYEAGDKSWSLLLTPKVLGKLPRLLAPFVGDILTPFYNSYFFVLAE